uniref:Uncharacterized protein n=1 Tax=Arundo donax TaxID=35708 RepID=A0A0A8Y181_ARUDO
MALSAKRSKHVLAVAVSSDGSCSCQFRW